MAEIKILGNALTIFSSLKTKDIRKVVDIAPEFTKLYEQTMDTATPELTFQVGTTPEPVEGVPTPLGSVSKYGIIFDSTDEDGKAYLTLQINRDNGLDKDAITEEFMPTMIKLNAVETRIKEAMEQINSDIEAVKKDIHVIG